MREVTYSDIVLCAVLGFTGLVILWVVSSFLFLFDWICKLALLSAVLLIVGKIYHEASLKKPFVLPFPVWLNSDEILLEIERRVRGMFSKGASYQPYVQSPPQSPQYIHQTAGQPNPNTPFTDGIRTVLSSVEQRLYQGNYRKVD
eukprot:TRINITY_DN882_c0_g1_i1.p1 TRINITY_DN882_c0_g1~~TRINITY_DN882_c0_g1_i1.p1  ORF type:complete len:145 (-),score=27.82 TRINITY_DN882_c0_g1_i1:153-587(-)